MPTLRAPVFGSFVMTAGSVMNGAGSPGQQRWIGSRPRSTSAPSKKTSWQGALDTVFGRESATDLSLRSPRTFSRSPSGGCMSRMSPSLAAASSSVSTPNAMHMRFSVPNWLMSSGCSRALGLLEQQRRAAGLHDAIGDLGDLEVGVGLRGDPSQLALALEERDPLAEVSGRSQSAVSLWTREQNHDLGDCPRPIPDRNNEAVARRGLVTRVVALA